MAVATGVPTSEIGYTRVGPASMWWAYDEEATPELRWPQSITVYDAMRTQDAQVGSVLEAVTRPILRTPWRIDPAGARDEVVEFVAQDLGLPIKGHNPEPPPRTKDRFSWLEHLELVLLMLPFGHMYFEQSYRVDKGGARAHLHKLGPRMPRTIEAIEVARDGGLLWIKQLATLDQNGPQKPIPVDRLVAYIYKREGGNWLGRSILRQAYKNWLIKDRLLRVQAQTIERNGMGIPLYTDSENPEPGSLDAGLSTATRWRAGESAGSAIPFGAKLELVGVNGTLPDADPAIRYHDEQIARAVLAHFLNLGTQTGSWALGTTFAEFFTLSLQTLGQQVADVGSQHVVEDLVDLNWGPEEPAPRITFDEIGSRQEATAASIKSLIDAKVITPDDVLEESTRQQYGLPPADADTARDTASTGGLPPASAADNSAVVNAIDTYQSSSTGSQSVAASAPVEARAPYPGQRYRHGWILLAGFAMLGDDYTPERLEELYGGAVDNEEFAPGAFVELGQKAGEIHFDIAGETEDRYHIFAETDAEGAQRLSDDIDWARDKAWDLAHNMANPGHRPPDPVNGLQDWRFSGEFIVGFTPDGQTIRIGYGAPDEPTVVSMDLSVDEAKTLQEALSRLSDTDWEDA